MVVPALWPRLTIETLAFFQRLLLGGPTKRIQVALIRRLPWSDFTSFPYRLREHVLRLFGQSRDVDPLAKGYGPWTELLIKGAAFGPTLVGMLVPIAVGAWLTSRWPSPAGAWSRVVSLQGLLGLVCFAAYVVACAMHELVRAWRRVMMAAAVRDNGNE